MRYELMFPHQIRKAIDENWPIVLPLGVLEYHGEHCVNGVDTLLVVRAFEALEKEMDLVLMPAFWYGAASVAVGPTAASGTLPVRAESIIPFAKELFTQLLRNGFRNIHAFVHHQSENFKAGMPTDLAFRFAARQIIFDFLDREKGEGWWGREEMRHYYASREAGADPFSWISVHPLMAEEVQKKYPIDHAGLQETSLMMAFCPEGVDMAKFDPKLWYCETGASASLAYGQEARREILASLKKTLGG